MGSIGNTQLKIGENNEILAKGDGIMLGYYKKPEETAKVFTPDGWFKTGDAGEFDDNGNLVITDRIKDLMKTSNGKYIAPQPIENLFSNNSLVQQIMLIAEGKPFVTALIVPNFEYLQEQLSSLNVKFTNWKDVLSKKEVIEFYNKKISEIQKSLPKFEQVKKFVLIPTEFEISSGEITPTLKIKRNVILSKYADLIDMMYKMPAMELATI
ncbi:MAG: AMP-binding protein [Saprospiraceae bacterium]